ncbi:MAG: hydroxymethylbilane synthase [Desulfobacteraceae bacterium]|nr:hydroxymethylbilane synthase [Desulfobacteraceae bacterium]
MMTETVRIGTRGSQLALWQANWVKAALERSDPSLSVELTVIRTRGDKIVDVPLAKVGGKGLFVKEIEDAILQRRVDLAVHSMKDMPAEIPEGLCIGAVPEREDPRDVLVSRKNLPLAQLPERARVGTSSLRRAAQLRLARSDLDILPLRGNLDTRLKKLTSENLDAVVLAAAGIRRMGFQDRVTEYLNEEVMLPAVGQGALCIETRTEDPFIGPLVAALDDAATHTVVAGERAFLQRLEGGCQVPIAGHGSVDNSGFSLTGLVADVEGTRVVRHRLRGPAETSERIGRQLAETLLSRGADEILSAVYGRPV